VQIARLQDAFDAADPAAMEHPLVNLTLANFQRRGGAGRLLTAVDAYAYDSVWAAALGIIRDADSGDGNLIASIRALSFSGASGAVSFNVTGDRGPAGLVVRVENMQALGGLGGAWAEANWSTVLLVSTPIGVVDLTLGFNRSAQATPCWPGGRQSWTVTAPADAVDKGQRSEIMFLLIFLLLGVLALVLAYMYFTRSEEADQALMAKMIELRRMLGITRQHGFVLSSERIPLWRRREDITFMQKSFMEAAGRLALFQDFDVTLFDNFCVCVKSSSRMGRESREHYDRLCEWLLEISKECLSPNELSVSIQKPKTLLEGLWLSLAVANTSSDGSAHTKSKVAHHDDQSLAIGSAPPSRKVWNLGEVNSAHALSQAKVEYSELQARHQRLREERFKFFTDKVAKVKLWRDDEGVLFERLKLCTQDLMTEIANLCNDRYSRLCCEVMGKELVAYSDVFDLGSKVCSILEPSAQALHRSAPTLNKEICRQEDM
jgi:hypothetical protein